MCLLEQVACEEIIRERLRHNLERQESDVYDIFTASTHLICMIKEESLLTRISVGTCQL